MLSVTNIGNNSDKTDQQIKERESQNKTINIIEINNTVLASDDQQIMVNFNESECKFALYNKNKTLLGSFTAHQLIKYIATKIHSSFLDTVDCQSAIGIIEKYICTITNSDGFVKINLLNQLASPFMGNIEMVMKLYQGVGNYDSKHLPQELEKISDEKIRKKVSGIIKQLIYLLLNHALRLVANISDVIKNDDSKKELKDMLIKYSVVIVYKMSNFMKDEVETKMGEYKLLQDDLVRMGKVKIEMYKKITEIKTSIQEQNNQLAVITSKINNSSQYMYGGEISNPTEKLISLTSNSSGESENSRSHDSSKSSDSDSSRSDDSTESESSKTSDVKKKSDKHKSELFSNSDCYFTESGDDVNINYLSTTDQQNSKSIISEIQSMKRSKKIK
jgi:hypothetical protein